jgi:hypothetical protein
MDEAVAEVERLYDVQVALAIVPSEEVAERSDMTISLAFQRRMAPGDYRRWPKYTFEYPNVPQQAVEATGALLMGVMERIADEGIELISVPTEGREDNVVLGATGSGITHDQVMVIEQFGIEMADNLGDFGFDHAETRGLKTERAGAVREKRGEGHFKEAWKSSKSKKSKKD